MQMSLNTARLKGEGDGAAGEATRTDQLNRSSRVRSIKGGVLVQAEGTSRKSQSVGLLLNKTAQKSQRGSAGVVWCW